MPIVCHHSHLTNVHAGYSPGAVIATAASFTVGGQMIARVGDLITPHTRPQSPPHIGATISAGAPTFTVGGMPVARVNDPTSCGGKMAQGFSRLSIG